MRIVKPSLIIATMILSLAQTTVPATAPASQPISLARVLSTMPANLKVSRDETAIRRMQRETWLSDQVKGKEVVLFNAKITELVPSMTVDLSSQTSVTLSGTVPTDRKLKKGDGITAIGTVRLITSKITASDTRLVVVLTNVTVK